LARASFDHGVLEIRVAKPEERKSRKVPISVGHSDPKTVVGMESDQQP
jgi:hypothetical protein